MKIDHSTLLFFDASCLIAAAGSPSGGSSFLSSICARGPLKAAVSQPVLLEAERNILSKLGPEAFDAYYRLIALTPFVLVPLPPRDRRRVYGELVGEKDEHVVTAALEVRAPFLLTLDKGLEARVNAADLPVHALSPGVFIKTVLPYHAGYPSVR